MIAIRTMTVLFGCLALSWTAGASDDCSSCSDGIEVKFMMEEDIKGSFSVTLNGVTAEGTGEDTNEPSRTEWGETKLVPDEEYFVTVDVGTDEDEANDKGSDEAALLFEGKSCGVVFEVYTGYPGSEEWQEVNEAAVWSNQGNSVWGFGASYEMPANNIKVRFRKKDDSEAGADENSQDSPTITDPGSDFPTSPTDQPDGITPAGLSHVIQFGNAPRYAGEEGMRVSAGVLRLRGLVGSPGLASRSNLKYSVLSAAGATLKQTAGVIDQVETGSILAIAADETSGFSVKLYGEGSYQEIGTSGVFEPAQGATPLTTVLYEPLVATSSHAGGIRITKTANGTTQKRDIVAPVAGASSWRETIYDFQTGSPLQITESNSVFMPVADVTKWQRTDVVTVTRDGVPYSKTEEDWIYEPWGRSLSKRRVFTTSSVYEETEFTYYTQPNTAYYGNLKNEIRPDGSWVEYVYQDGVSNMNGYAPGQLLYRYEPWLSQSPSVPTQSNAVRTEYSYGIDPKTYSGYFATVSDKSIRTVTGITVSQTDTDSNLTHTATHTSMDASTALSREVHYSIAQNWMNYPEKEVSPDGTVTEYSYDKLEFDPVTETYSSSANGEFTEVIRKNGHDNAGAVAYVAGKSTGTRTITDPMGRTVRQGMLVYTGSGGGWTEVSADTWLHEDTNGDAMPDKTTHLKDGQTISIVQKISELETHSWDRAGWQTITITDELGRTKSIRRVGRNGQADILTSYSYEGRDTTVTVTGGSLSVESGTTYDLLGRMLSSTDENGLVTYRSYGFATGGGRTVTTTRPDGKTEIESYHLDGKPRSVTGTGVVARYYEYEVDDGTGAELGFITTTERIGSDISPRLTDTKRDWDGQTRKVARPAYTGTWLSQRFYKSNGQLDRVQETGLAPVRYEYDSLGAMFRTGRDVDSNGALDMNSKDSITETVTDYVEETGTGWVQRRTTLQWLTDDNPAATIISAVKSVIADPDGDTRMLDVHSEQTTTTVSVASGVVTTTTNVPFADIDIVRKTEGGRLISENTATVATPTEYGYDDLGRMTTVTGPLGAVTQITYEPGTYRQKTVTPPVGPYNEYLYIPQGQNGAGQIWQVITRDRANGAELSRLTYTYNARGNRVSETGSGTYPVEDRCGKLS